MYRFNHLTVQVPHIISVFIGMIKYNEPQTVHTSIYDFILLCFISLLVICFIHCKVVEIDQNTTTFHNFWGKLQMYMHLYFLSGNIISYLSIGEINHKIHQLI